MSTGPTNEPSQSAPLLSRQLALELGGPVLPTLANFIVGRNGPALKLLLDLQSGGRAERQLHLWGSAGSGRSHLLQALAAAPEARYVSASGVAAGAVLFDPATSLWCIDDVEHAGAALQLDLFNLINAVRDHAGAAIVTAADAPPLYLSLREDLRTRLGWGPVFQIQPLDDGERAAALAQRARERGLQLSDEVCSYLLTHFNRDMSSLIALLDALDRYALERQRAITLPLVREWLHQAPAAHPVS